MHVRQLWNAYEAVRTRQDRQELLRPRNGNGILPAAENEGDHAAQAEAASDPQEAPEAEWLTAPATSPSSEPSRALDW